MGADHKDVWISTHDLTKRSTPRQSSVLWYCSHFNSRPHEEVDLLTPNSLDLSFISTHDLTKRSTSLAATFYHLNLYFNSRPHEEVDMLLSCPLWLLGHFNSRPHEEVDSINEAADGSTIIFQLTTSRRGRLCGQSDILPILSFQLTTSRRGRQQKYTNHPILLLMHLAYSTKTHHSITHNRIYSTLSFNKTSPKSGANPLRFHVCSTLAPTDNPFKKSRYPSRQIPA